MSTRTLFGPLVAHQFNQQGAMQRAAAARAMGLDPAEFGTVYPGSTVVNATTNTARNWSWLWGAVLAAVLLLLGVGGTMLAVHFGAGPSAAALPATSGTAPGTMPATTQQGWDALIEEQQPDGSWKMIRREHLK